MNTSSDEQRRRPSYEVRVAAATSVTPNMRRLSLEGNALAKLEVALPAQWMKVVITPPEAAVRPNRAYTVRQFEPERSRIVMDFVLHGDTGPLSAWASRAQIDDIVYVGAPRGGHRINPQARWRVLAGDETALPAICSILELLPADDVPTHVIIEVPTAADVQALRAPRRGEIHWLAREATGEKHGHLLEAAVASLPVSDRAGQVFMAGEAGAIRKMKADITRRAPHAEIDAKGYWLIGAADHRE